ncbi:c-type cytochrome [Profundibacterium mesophilum]|uniref:Cb-type cytochrome c oxidase subunit III n=1 Tax=Profundibacterium mesophilum KAUST100406-0324 TaxID=1037889 RepID=A0A921TD54_9RHOB|nr:cytochrome c [Profundibacterium mesophilum]KAF0675762.1 cb-type cytochrome c oxidase subunit III [Profundibacterium mesophilum KAUST100406-0324]
MPRNVILIAFALAAVVGLALWASGPEGPAPGEMAGHSMTPPDTDALEAGAPIVEVVVPAAFEGRAALGETAFNAACAACHGQNAAGQNGVAPPLVHKIYEPSHHGDMAFQLAVKNGVRAHHWTFGNMPPVEGLTNGDVGNIVAYVRRLQEENGIE